MKILHTVEFYSPSVGGAQEVIRRISEELVAKGSDVTVATSKLPERTQRVINGVKIEEFAISGNAVRGFREATPGESKRYQEFLVSGHFDVMMNYAAQQWATDLALPELERIPYRKVLAPCGLSGLYRPEYSSYFVQLLDAMKRYDHLIFHSNVYRDIEFARQHGITHYTVVPNGASEQEFTREDPTFRQRYGIPEDVPLLLTVGSHTGTKGHNLVMRAFRRANIKRACLIVAGNGIGGCYRRCRLDARLTNALSLGRKKVLLLDPPRRDVVAAYHAADLFVFGSEIECSPIVLFEAMAAKTTFVTTACGNAEEILAWSKGGVLLPAKINPDGSVSATATDMAKSIDYLLSHPEEREALSANAYKTWRERFTWEKIATEYERVYSQVLERRSS